MFQSKLLIAASAALLMCASCDDPKKASPETPKETNTANQKVEKVAVGVSKQPKTSPTSAKKGPPLQAIGPVAIVNGKEISAKMFNDEVSKMLKMMPMFPPGQAEQLKGRLLDNLISKELIDVATEPEMANVKQSDVDSEYKKFLENAANMPGGVDAFFKKMDLTEATFKVELKKSVALKNALDKKFGVAVKPAAVKEFYDKNKTTRFKVEEQVKASHILFMADDKSTEDQKTAAKVKADKIYKEAKAKGADFAALAKANSEGPSASKGGDLGFFSKGKMVPEFAEAAWKTKKGGVTKPVKTQFGWHIIKVIDKKKGRTIPFKEVKEQIEGDLERGNMKKYVQDYLTDLKKTAKIEKMEKNIKINESAAPPMMPNMPKMPNFGGKNPGKKLQLKMPAGK